MIVETVVTVSVHYEGWLGLLLARWTRRLSERYLALEANGLKARCVELSATPHPEHHETR